MPKKQIILILCILWTGGSVAKSFYPTPNGDYYRVESRMAPSPRYRGRSASTTPRPLIQQYWQQFVRNLPTLPPLRWNMTTSLGNLFAAGAQQIIETPVVANQRTEKPSRRRVNPTQKKKNKNRQRLQASRTDYYDNSYPLQLQLQPLGVDKNGVMHLYEPSARQFYALQVEPQLAHYDLYSPHNEAGSYQEEQGDDAYYAHSDYGNKDNAYQDENSGYEEDDAGYEEQSYETHGQKYEANNNDYDNYGSDDSNVEVVDNWGYNDEDVFADRKIKGVETNNLQALAGSIIRIQKNLLKPETEEDALHQLNEANKPVVESSKHKVRKEAVVTNYEESGRDVWSGAMNNAGHKKRKETIKRNKASKIYIKLPRTRGNFVYTPVIFSVGDKAKLQKQ
ncbi:hypothetical protein DOY81_008413 [Sarcophaga bullata]|nr:hypothetical protein DOY81_008413 [Sarcophaga bullata]